jgi:S1-C subfamily serine protease
MQYFEPDPQYPVYGVHPPLPPEAPVPPAPDPVTGAAARRRRLVRTSVAGVAVLAAICATAGVGYAVGASHSVSGTGSALPSVLNPGGQSGTGSNGNGNGNGSGSGSGSGSGNGGYGNYPWPGTGSGTSPGTTSQGTATAAQSVGVVDIQTVLGYQNAAAAGTGLVVTPSGEVVTNNHVVNGATSIRVTVVSTGSTYTATVVGTDPTDDVAVLQLSNASGLATANFGDSSSVKVGDSVVGVGNAGGQGGTPSAAAGHVTALDQTVTASDENGSDSETVTGMIETNAPIEAGDSGGPLYNSSGKVIGIDTAAATGRFGSTIAAYAIPVDKALSIAGQIEAGETSSTIHIGSTGFVGVSVAQSSTGGALVEGVVPGGPAAKAGITAGDVITAVDGKAVTNAAKLHTLLQSTKPGQQVTLTWQDQGGATHRATVTLIQGPAD